jgi:hypothetical protein
MYLKALIFGSELYSRDYFNADFLSLFDAQRDSFYGVMVADSYRRKPGSLSFRYKFTGRKSTV